MARSLRALQEQTITTSPLPFRPRRAGSRVSPSRRDGGHRGSSRKRRAVREGGPIRATDYASENHSQVGRLRKASSPSGWRGPIGGGPNREGRGGRRGRRRERASRRRRTRARAERRERARSSRRPALRLDKIGLPCALAATFGPGRVRSRDGIRREISRHHEAAAIRLEVLPIPSRIRDPAPCIAIAPTPAHN